jgi:hypothetical protein
MAPAAVDMDVYGAFQFCSIGILAAPVTVRLSRTYFNTPGRNIIFLWMGLILTGLVSLAIEFYRLNTVDCTHDDAGNPVSPDPSKFGYNTTCNLTCSTDDGPFSPMRGGSANNIYVIPAPTLLTFGAATLISAACCVPAVLNMITMWNKVLEANWTRFRESRRKDDNKEIEGTNNATHGQMKVINEMVRGFLGVVEIGVFGGAVMAILIIGENNFFSYPVRYMTEPMATIGR